MKMSGRYGRVVFLVGLLGLPATGWTQNLINFSPAALLAGKATAQRFQNRFSFNTGHYRLEGFSSELHEPDYYSLSWLQDWRPWRDGGFHVSAGVFYQRDAVVPTYGHYFHDLFTHQPENGFMGYHPDTLTPYLGLGWNGSFTDSHHLGMNFDMGFLYQPDFSQRILEQPLHYRQPPVRGLLRELESIEVLPVFSLGVSYSF